MSNEWYTPSKYIEAARSVMGSIDLDPASCELANQTVRAARYYTQEDNGLAQEWRGNLFINPPFGNMPIPDGSVWQGHSRAGLFIQRLLWEYEKGNIDQAILLTKADPKQLWFKPLWNYLLCFVDKDIYFSRPKGAPSRMQFGTVFVYLGWNEQAFVEQFSKFGRIAKAIDTPVARPRQLELVS